jgi:8-oxo-dGTP diphosphatase
MRDRGAAIIIEHNQLALIKRIRETEVYYVFSGGGIEEGETPEETTIREVKEELGVTVEIQELLMTIDFNGTQYYFLTAINDGEFGTGCGIGENKNGYIGDHFGWRTFPEIWVAQSLC